MEVYAVLDEPAPSQDFTVLQEQSCYVAKPRHGLEYKDF